MARVKQQNLSDLIAKGEQSSDFKPNPEDETPAGEEPSGEKPAGEEPGADQGIDPAVTPVDEKPEGEEPVNSGSGITPEEKADHGLVYRHARGGSGIGTISINGQAIEYRYNESTGDVTSLHTESEAIVMTGTGIFMFR